MKLGQTTSDKNFANITNTDSSNDWEDRSDSTTINWLHIKLPLLFIRIASKCKRLKIPNATFTSILYEAWTHNF